MKRSLRVEIRPKNRMWSSLQRLAEERQVDIREDGSVYTSSTCVLRWGQSDSYVDLAPEMDAAFSLPVGKYVRPQWQLELTEISVDNGCFVVALTMEDGEDYPKVRAPSRIMAMDLGIANFAAISSNTGERGILFKGAVLLSACHAYDRYMQEKAAGNHPGDSEDREKALRRKRNDYFRDYELKVIKILSSWCKEKDIDTIVVGSLHNESEAEKQGVSPLPYDEFRGLLRDMCLRQGMNYVEQDELFTSRASFCDGDVIPDLFLFRLRIDVPIISRFHCHGCFQKQSSEHPVVVEKRIVGILCQ